MTWSEVVYGVLFQPVNTLRYLADEKPVGRGLVIFTLVTVVNFILLRGSEGTGSDPLSSLFREFFPLYATLGTFFALFVLLLTAGFLSLLGELFYRRGNASGLLTCLALAVVPGLVGSALQYAMFLLDLAVLGMVISLVTIAWVMVLQVLSLRESLALTTGQAVLIYILPAVSLLVMALILVFVLASRFPLAT